MLFGWLLQNKALDLKSTKHYSRLKADVTGLFLRAYAHLPQAQTHLLRSRWSLVSLSPFSVCRRADIQITPWSQVWARTASPHYSNPRISPPRGSEQPPKHTPNHVAAAASCCLPPAAPCRRGRAVTSLPSSLALTDARSSYCLSNSCRRQAPEVSHSSLPVVGFPAHLKSLQSDGPPGRQSLPPVCRCVQQRLSRT